MNSKFHTIKLATVALSLLLSVSTAQATLIDGAVTGGTALSNGGIYQKLGVPLGNPFGPVNSVGANTFESPNLFGFDESQNTTTTGVLSYDYGVGGATGSTTNAGSIAANTTVASHYVFFDPINASIQGWIEFDSKILGVITSTATLAASDYLANTGVNYLNPTLRGLEGNDKIITVTNNKVFIDFVASSPGDYIRILTEFSPAAAPEPGMLLLLSISLLGLGLSRRRLS
ncbi:MAG: hypothetical protein COA96_03685 [SAR86 cluster bacterium]|uniref:Ice-binding protein C-terminal domain-containing protein n=1 Tax=SAR86 cluster bacterium TaxID=2030880 RepID=A0A2A5B6U7_9GAMM|nr:MAG: hypothetical protein COA96_03685 [SAR86 cluster bacterium]